MAGKKTSTTNADADDKAIADAVEAEVDGVKDTFVTNPEDLVEQDSHDAEIEDAVVFDANDQPDQDLAEDSLEAGSDLTDLDSDDARAADYETAEDDLTDDWARSDNDMTTSVEESGAEPTQVDEPEALRDTARPEAAPAQPSRFFPMLLGGLVAGGIGFGAAYTVLPRLGSDATLELRQEITAQLQTQAGSIEALSGQIGNLPPPADLSELEAAQTDLTDAIASLTSRLEEADNRFGELDARLTDVEKRPLTENASDAAVAAYERELKALQDSMAAQRAEIEAMTVKAQTIEASAEDTAQATMRRAAVTRIQTALDTGTGFAPALADLETAGLTPPDILVSVAEEGVPSLAQLQTGFPEAARAALKASRRVAAEQDEGVGFSTFLKNQLGARSLEPREGDDPDAVLSRAEAATRDGRLNDALAEIDALPDEGRAEIADWAAKAKMRLDAMAAAEMLGNELN